MVIAEMQKDPKAAYEKYGNNPQFREFMTEFSGLMGAHFEETADKKAQEEKEAAEKQARQEEEMKSDPVYQKIQNDPKVKETLADPKVVKLIQRLQVERGLDFHQIAREDDATAQKLMFLINAGVLNTQNTMP